MAENDTNAGTDSSDNAPSGPTQSESEGNPATDTDPDLTFQEWQELPKEDKSDTKHDTDKSHE